MGLSTPKVLLVASIILLSFTSLLIFGWQAFKKSQAQKQQEAIQIKNIVTEEKKIAGIDQNGKLTTERAAFLAQVVPESYQGLVDQDLVADPAGVAASLQAQGGGTIPSVSPTPIPIPLSPSINSCGEITSSGNYYLSRDISEPSECIRIHDTQNVNLDCQNHTIASTSIAQSNTDIPLLIRNVQNFSIKNCNINPDSNNSGNSLWILNSNSGVIEKNTISQGQEKTRKFDVYNSNSLKITDNNISGMYSQTESSSNQIINNRFLKNETLLSFTGVIILTQGSNNSIENNIIDGGWDGRIATPREIKGADDGIIIADETGDKITGNTINNNWDCGIESLGFIQDTQIRNNRIYNSGLCGIGGWYWNSWRGNIVDSNFVDRALQIFTIFYIPDPGHSWGHIAGDIYFKDNIFSNNVFSNQISPIGASALINYTGIGDSPESHLYLGNNVFRNNDFGETLPFPVLLPASMIVDQGGNKCTNHRLNPLNCQTSGLIPSPTALPTPSTLPASPSPSPLPSPVISSPLPTPIPALSPTPIPTPSPTIIPSDKPSSISLSAITECINTTAKLTLSWTTTTTDTQFNIEKDGIAITSVIGNSLSGTENQGETHQWAVYGISSGVRSNTVQLQMPICIPSPTPAKTVISMTINGQEVNLNNPSLNIKLPGVEGQPQVFTIPVTVTYSDGSIRYLALSFNYQPSSAPTLQPTPTPQPTPTLTLSPLPSPAPTITPVLQICTRVSPTVAIIPQIQKGNPGQSLKYTIRLTNNDINCQPATFIVSLTTPQGFSYSDNNLNFINLSAGSSASNTVFIDSPLNATNGSYEFNISAYNESVPSYSSSAKAYYDVDTPTPVPTPLPSPPYSQSGYCSYNTITPCNNDPWWNPYRCEVQVNSCDANDWKIVKCYYDAACVYE